jgi:catechol 2,3-dioxygenase-like lactoylglutathione lyase family enzyme
MTTIDQLLDQYERGGLTRRQLMEGLLLLAVPSTTRERSNRRGEQGSRMPAIAPCRSINHFGFNVSDIERSMAFYSAVFGATERGRGSLTHATMKLPNSTKTVGCFISLSKTDRGAPGTYSHVGFGMDWSSQMTPNTIADRVRQSFPMVKPPTIGPDTGPRRIEMMIYDPDGLPLQFVGTNDDGWECPGITPGSCS